MKLSISILALLTIVSSISLFAEEPVWPRFRGANGDGQGGGSFPAQFDVKDAKWTAELAGEAHSSPVVNGDRIIVTFGAKDGKRGMQCLSLKDGSELWKIERPFKEHRRHKANSYATSTPALDADHIFAVWGEPDAIVVEALNYDGKSIWKKDIGGYKGNHGYGMSPIRFEDLVILGNDQDGESSLIALKAKSGDVAWTVDRSSKRLTYSTPVIYTSKKENRKEIIFSNWQHGLTSVNPADGSIYWESPVFDTSTKQRAIGSPIVAGDLVIGTCGFFSSKKRLVALRPAAEGKPIEAFRVERSVPHIPTPLAVGDLLFLWSDSGIATCVRLSDGKTLWQERVPGTKFFGSPIHVDGKIYNISSRGEVVCLAAKDAYEHLGTSELGEGSQSTPAVAGNLMLLRSFTKLHAIPGKE